MAFAVTSKPIRIINMLVMCSSCLFLVGKVGVAPTLSNNTRFTVWLLSPLHTCPLVVCVHHKGLVIPTPCKRNKLYLFHRVCKYCYTCLNLYTQVFQFINLSLLPSGRHKTFYKVCRCRFFKYNFVCLPCHK